MDNTESTGQSNTPKTGSNKFILPLIVVVLIIVGVVGFMVLGKNNTSQKAQEASTKSTSTTQVPTEPNAISSIKDALLGSASLKCEFTDESGHNITSYLKSGAIRSDIVASDPKQSGSMIMKDKKMYFWNGTQGTMMEFDVNSMMDKTTPAPKITSAPSGQSPESVIESMEKFKKSCKPSAVDSGLFIPPTNVKFTDVSAMMKSIKTNVTGMPQTTMSEEQIKALQEKYKQ